MMRRIAFILSLVLILASCGNWGKPEHIKIDGVEMVVINGDTLGVIYETHVVKSCEIATPRSIHEEMNPKFTVNLEDNTSFRSRNQYQIGDTIVYTIYTKSK